ncbi:MAG: Ig-like domain-containing protein [Gammaproteobacteria bacterium]|nr:Ig-like domain-containing protein [Gammaproteobacteria bacterium]
MLQALTRIRIVLFLSFAFLLTACGGGEPDPGIQVNVTLTGCVANMGVVVGGRVSVYKFENGARGAALGEALLSDVNGTFDLTAIAQEYSGPVMVVLDDPDGNTLYFNEADGAFTNFPKDAEGNSDELRAVADSLNQAIAVTPLTEVATQLAMHFVTINGLGDADAIKRANNEVSNALIGGIDPINTLPVDVRQEVAGSTNNAAVYANVLAGIAYVAKRNDITPIQQADRYASNLINNDADFMQDDLGDLILAIANFNSSPPDNVYVPEISTDIAPVAYGQTVLIDEDEITEITLHGGDLNRLPVLFTIEAQPQHGRLTGTPPNLTYEPNANYNGQDSFRFLVNNGFRNSDATLINIVINTVSDAPVASDSVILTAENESGTGTLRASDPDEDALTYSIVDSPVLGSIVSLDQETGEFVYTPNVNTTGGDSFTFKVNDGTTDSNVATMSVNIQSDGSKDSDGDGLLDAEETSMGTNPFLPDTDGDGFTDYEELVEFAFNPAVNNFRFNPLIADTPKIELEILSMPDYLLNFSDATNLNTTAFSESPVTQSVASSQAVDISRAYDQGEPVYVTSELLGFTSRETAIPTSTYTYQNTISGEHAAAYSTARLADHQILHNDIQAKLPETVTTGQMDVEVRLINYGNQAYKINSLSLDAATVYDESISQDDKSIGQLNNFFTAFTLSPGQSSSTLSYTATGLDGDVVKELIRQGKGVTLRPGIFDISDHTGISYNFSAKNIVTNDVMVMVDYNGHGGRRNIKEMVAVRGNPDQNINLIATLESILKLEVVREDVLANVVDQDGVIVVDDAGNAVQENIGHLKSVDGINELYEGGTISQSNLRGHWVLVHGRQSGGEVITDVYVSPHAEGIWQARSPNLIGNLISASDLSKVTLNGGEVLHLVYMLDEDNDQLANVREYFRQTPVDIADADADGALDGEEVKGWDVAYVDANATTITKHVTSEPTVADTDGDGVLDGVEANLSQTDIRMRRDPRVADTDGDLLYDDRDDVANIPLTVAPDVQANAYDLMLPTEITAASLNTGDPTDVAVSYSYPVALADIGADAGNYTLDIYRQEVLKTLDIVEPTEAQGPTGVSDALLTSASGNWGLVETSAGLPLITNSFTDITGLNSTNKVKYIAYVWTNGAFHRVPLSATASTTKEVISIQMQPGSYSKKNTVYGPKGNASYPYAAGDPIRFFTYTYSVNNVFRNGSYYYEYKGYNYVYLSCAYSLFGVCITENWGYRHEYKRYNSSLGVVNSNLRYTNKLYASSVYNNFTHISQVVNSRRHGDGNLDVRWYLYLGGSLLNSPYINYRIDSTEQILPNYYSDISGTTQSSNTVNGTTLTATAMSDIFTRANAGMATKTVAAVSSCHILNMDFYEYDSNFYYSGGYYSYAYPQDPALSDNVNDTVRLQMCRNAGVDAAGVWEVKSMDGSKTYGTVNPDDGGTISVPVEAIWGAHSNYPYDDKAPVRAVVNTTLIIDVDQVP